MVFDLFALLTKPRRAVSYLFYTTFLLKIVGSGRLQHHAYR